MQLAQRLLFLVCIKLIFNLYFIFGYIYIIIFIIYFNALLDYNLSSPEYSTWTESVWHEVQIRMFLRQSLKLQIFIFIFGVSTFIFSFIIVRKMYAQSAMYFSNQE